MLWYGFLLERVRAAPGLEGMHGALISGSQCIVMYGPQPDSPFFAGLHGYGDIDVSNSSSEDSLPHRGLDGLSLYNAIWRALWETHRLYLGVLLPHTCAVIRFCEAVFKKT